MKASEILNSITSPNAATRKAAAKNLKASQQEAAPLNYSALTLAEKRELLAIFEKAEKVNGLVNYDSLSLNENLRLIELLEKTKDGANGN